jgi:nucleoside-specific outer membrane channel protein Tsx
MGDYSRKYKMNNYKLLVRHTFAFSALLLSTTTSVQAADWSDNSISYLYGTRFAEPGINGPITKNIVEFAHSDGYKYGSNFFDVQALFSDINDPANGGDNGATEVYVVYRHQLSLNKISGQDYKWGPVRDWSLSGGLDWNTKNTTFAPAKRMLVIGPTINFDVPGFWDLSVMYRSESNHNGLSFAQEHDIRFNNTYYLETAWDIPFHLATVPLKFKGFANFVPPKGKDGFGNDTVSETLVHASLLVDVGELTVGKKNTFFAGVGYEYWKNKFGNNSANTPGTEANAPFLNLEWHL